MRLTALHISDGIRITLFDNPASAPCWFILKDDSVISGLAGEVPDDNIQAWSLRAELSAFGHGPTVSFFACSLFP